MSSPADNGRDDDGAAQVSGEEEPYEEDDPAPDPPSSSAPAPPAASPASPSRPSSDPQRVVYLGDSLAMEAQDVLGHWIRRSPRVAGYQSAPVAGTTLCDYLRGRPERSLVKAEHKAAAIVRKERPGVVVLQFWGNTWGYTPCMGGIEWGTPEYYTRYAADARAITDQVSDAAERAGIPRPKIVWVRQPPDALHPERIERVNEIYAKQAAAVGDLVADGGRELRDGDGKWIQRLPCDDYERAHPGYCAADGTAQLHRDDDPLHFCLAPTPEGGRPCPAKSPGLVRYSRAVAEVVSAYLKD